MGSSLKTAAAVAGITHVTLNQWMRRGEQDRANDVGGQYAQFAADVELARAAPRVRALDLLYKLLPDNPQLVWKYLERVEPGFEAPQPGVVQQPNRVVVELHFSDGTPALPMQVENEAGVVEGEVLELPGR